MKKILIVVDMQNDFIDGSLGTKEAESIVDHVVEEINKDYSLVIATRDTHPENYLKTNEGKHLPVKHCIKHSESWHIRPDIFEAIEAKESRVHDKSTYGSEKLVEILKKINEEEEIETITLIGLCTDICVVSNALLVKAAFPEKRIEVKENCCAGVTPQSHEAALTTMKMCQIEVI